jgi:hypothetical protein
MIRKTVVTVVVAVLVLLVALPSAALAAKPYKEVIDLGTPEEEAFVAGLMTEICGFPVEASLKSRVTVHVIFDRHGDFKREIDGYLSWDTLINPATGASVTLHDVGPDLYWLSDDGSVLHAYIGRSLTGSGYIGRFVENLDTGEVLFIAGRNVGSLYDQICVPLGA